MFFSSKSPNFVTCALFSTLMLGILGSTSAWGQSTADQFKSTVSASSLLARSDGVAQITITVTVKDGNKNPVPGVLITLADVNGINTPFHEIISAGSNGGFSDINGVVTFTITDTVAETFGVASSDLADGFPLFPNGNKTVLTYSAGPDAAASKVSGSSAIPADGITTGTVTVTALDVHGNPFPGTLVNLTDSAGNATILPVGAMATTDANGIAKFTVSGTTIEQDTFTATDLTDNLVFLETATVTFIGLGDPLNSTVQVAGSNPVPAGTSTTIAVKVFDINGATVVGDSITLADSTGHATIYPLGSNVSDQNGNVTFLVAGSTAETDIFTATDTTDGFVFSQTASVTFTSAVPGAPNISTSTVSASPAAAPAANNTPNITIKVTVKDELGNPLKNVEVDFSSFAPLYFPLPPSIFTDATGVAQISFGSLSSQIATVNIKVAKSIDFPPVTASFFGSLSQTNSTVVASPAAVTNDGVATSTITVHLLDSGLFGLGIPPIIGLAGKSVMLAKTGNAIITSANPATADASGMATFTVIDFTPESATFTATDVTDFTMLTNTATVTFAPAADGTKSTVSPPTQSCVADGATKATITVTVNDGGSLPVAGKIVTLSAGSGRSRISVASGPSDVNGVVTFTVTDIFPEAVTYTAADASDNQLIAGTAKVTFTQGGANANQTGVAANPTSVLADGIASSTITATLRDAARAPIVGKTVVLLKTPGSSAVVSAASGPSDVNGNVTFTVTDTIVESTIFTAKDTTDNIIGAGGVLVQFTDGVSKTKSTAVATPTSVTADGQATSTITVTLLNLSNTVPQFAQVSLTKNAGFSIITPASVIADGLTGVATFTVTDTVAELATYSAAVVPIIGPNVTVAQKPTVTFTPGLPTPGQGVVLAAPNSVPADGATTATVIVIIKDLTNNPVAGKTVTLAKNSGSSVISAASGPSNANGVVTFTVTDTVAEQTVYTAKDTTDNVTFASTATVTFTPDPVSPGKSTVVASPASVLADGATASTITVTLNDAGARPVTGRMVSLSKNAGSSVISAASGLSNASGIVTFTVTDATAEQTIYSATDSTDNVLIMQTATVTYTSVVLPLALSSAPTATPSTAGVGQTVQFSAATNLAGTTFSWSFGDGTSDTSGLATPAHAYTAAGTFTATVTATNAGAVVTGSVTLTVKAPTVGTGNDSDGDGFSDAFENGAGSSPNDPNSIPFTLPGSIPALSAKADVSLNFAKNSDSLTLTGTVPVLAGFNGGKVILNIGTYSNAFMLDVKGHVKTDTAQGKFSIKTSKGVVSAQTSKFTIKITDSLEAALLPYGLVNNTVKNVSVSIPVTLSFVGVVEQSTLTENYTATKGKTGKTSK